MSPFRMLRRVAVIIGLSLLLLACSKINQDNFAKIKHGMAFEEVIKLLGEPTSTQTIDISGISGTSAVWKSDKVEIDIQFLNNRVTVKSFSTLDKDETE